MKFQDIFHHGTLPPSVLRMKGWIWFQEFPTLRFEFSFSGRGRLSLQQDVVGWSSKPITKIAVIGINLDVENIDQDLRDCCSSSNLSTDEVTFEDVKELISTNQFLRLHDTEEPFSMFTNEYEILPIRLSCLNFFPNLQTEEEFRFKFGINMNEVNREFCRIVNSEGQTILPLLLSSSSNDGNEGDHNEVAIGIRVCKRHENVDQEPWWEIIDRIASDYGERRFSNLSLCNCGK